ncbi:MAG: MFS transporter [Christensenellales bacterium]|jgi:MFS family permease
MDTKKDAKKSSHHPEHREIHVGNIPKKLVGMATEGWYIKGDSDSHSRASLLGYNYTANVIVNLIGGSFFTGLLILINASDSFIGTLTMIATAANMLQVFAPLFLERFTKRKKMLIALRAVLLFFNIVVIGIIPALPGGQQLQWTLMALSVLVVNLINALIAPGYTVWHIQCIPSDMRSSFFSLVTMTVGAVVALCNLGGSAIVDAFRASGLEYVGLLVVRGIAVLIAIVDIWLLTRIKELPYECGEKQSVKDLLVKPFRGKVYLKTVALTFLWNISANIPGNYYTVYLLKDLGISYSFIMLCSMLNIPVVILLTPVWRRVVQKLGWVRSLYTAMALYLLHYVLIAFTTNAMLWAYPVGLLYAFVMAIGINLPFAAIPYINIPKENQTVYIGFYSTIANMAALLGVTIGKFFIDLTDGVKIRLFGTEMINKQFILLLTASMMLLAVVGIWRVEKTMPREENPHKA